MDDFSQLADILSAITAANLDNFPAALDALTRSAARHVPGAQEASITVSGRRNEVSVPSVTNEWAKALDDIQQRHLEGPCLEAAWTRKTITVDDLETDQRWPGYRADALTQTPVRSVLSLPMFHRETGMGALNLYATVPRAFSDSSRQVAAAYATLGALAWAAAARETQFREALDSRDAIGQAKGILMERYDLTDEAAFNTLVALSQEMNVPVRDIAHRLIDDGHRHRQ